MKGVTIGKYRLLEKLGSGSFSQVYLCEDASATTSESNGSSNSTSTRYALKRISGSCEKLIEQELNAMKAMKGSENIVKFIDFFKDNGVPVIVMEFCEQGTLSEWQVSSTKDGVLSVHTAMEIFAGILTGFQTIHAAGFVHRDLKCSNILLQNGVPKIADFGFSRRATSQQMLNSLLGTPAYSAPEILQGKRYGYKVDIWSLGVILYRMLFGAIPFEGKSLDKLYESMVHLTEGGNFKISKAPKKKQQEVSVEIVRLFRMMFEIDPEKRIGFHELLSQECVSKYFKSNLTESLKFYSKVEADGSLDRLLLSQHEQEADSEFSPDNDDSNSLFASVVLHNQPVADSKDSGPMKLYLRLINQYTFLVECCGYFAKHRTLISSSSHYLLLQFFLVKLIVYYISHLKLVLDERENIFNLKNEWASFAHSKSYKLLSERVNRESTTWQAELADRLGSLSLINSEKFPSLAKAIQSSATPLEISEASIAYSEKLPDDIKLPCRAVFMTNIKDVRAALLADISKKSQQGDTSPAVLANTPSQRTLVGQTKKVHSTSNLNAGFHAMSNANQNAAQLAVAEAKQKETNNNRARLMLRLSVCAAWNRIFSVHKQHCDLGDGKHVEYDAIVETMHLVETEKALEHTNSIFASYFPQLKDFSYSFM